MYVACAAAGAGLQFAVTGIGIQEVLNRGPEKKMEESIIEREKYLVR